MRKAHNRIEYEKGDLINGVEFIRDTKTIKKVRFAIFKCRCGEEFEGRISDVRGGKKQSCGCIIIPGRKERATKHGLSDHPFYQMWCSIKDRCYNENAEHYHRYGGRGIEMYEPWKNNFQLFYDYLSLLEGYKEGLTIDRIKNNQGYSPDNLRWATKHTQTANRRVFENSSSGYKGIYLRGDKYYTDISVNGKRHYLGRHDSIPEAIWARNNFIIENELFEYPLQTYAA